MVPEAWEIMAYWTFSPTFEVIAKTWSNGQSSDNLMHDNHTHSPSAFASSVPWQLEVFVLMKYIKYIKYMNEVQVQTNPKSSLKAGRISSTT